MAAVGRWRPAWSDATICMMEESPPPAPFPPPSSPPLPPIVPKQCPFRADAAQQSIQHGGCQVRHITTMTSMSPMAYADNNIIKHNGGMANPSEMYVGQHHPCQPNSPVVDRDPTISEAMATPIPDSCLVFKVPFGTSRQNIKAQTRRFFQLNRYTSCRMAIFGQAHCFSKIHHLFYPVALVPSERPSHC